MDELDPTYEYIDLNGVKVGAKVYTKLAEGHSASKAALPTNRALH